MTSWLVQHHGTLISGGEIFMHSLTVDDAGAATSARNIAEEGAAKLRSALEASLLLNYIPIHTQWTHVTAAQIMDLSLGTLDPQYTVGLDPPIVGGSGTTLPPQVAMAISLKAGTYDNGSPLRGRFYLPAVDSSEFEPSGYISTVSQNAYLDFARLLVEEWDEDLTDKAAQVWSRKMATTQTIDEVRAGRVLDTIRSRRGELIEGYLTAAIPQGA